jgi:ATP-dependent protease ClpP protease subunit
MSRHNIWSMFCLSKNRLKPIVDYAMSRWSMIWYAAVYGQPIMLQRDKMMMLHQNLGIFKDPLPQHGSVASTNPYASSPQ